MEPSDTQKIEQATCKELSRSRANYHLDLHLSSQAEAVEVPIPLLPYFTLSLDSWCVKMSRNFDCSIFALTCSNCCSNASFSRFIPSFCLLSISTSLPRRSFFHTSTWPSNLDCVLLESTFGLRWNLEASPQDVFLQQTQRRLQVSPEPVYSCAMRGHQEQC